MDAEEIDIVSKLTGSPLGTTWRDKIMLSLFLLYTRSLMYVRASAVVMVIGTEKGPALIVTAATTHV